MTDKERREDDALKNLIQAAYDFSDEQLLADLEEVEATLSDSDFPGIEDRMYQKLKARMAEEENSAATLEQTSATAPAEAEKKVVRFGKKKVFVVGILAAAFVGMLGVTAIGGKNYFFRDRKYNKDIIIDNDKNIDHMGELKTAYEEIEEALDINVLKLGYIPDDMVLIEVELSENKAILAFEYDKKIVHFIQERLNKETSIGVGSDRLRTEESIVNKWLDKDIYLEAETYENGSAGFSGTVNIGDARYSIFGQLPKEEMILILERLFF